MDEDRLYQVALTLIPGIGNKNVRNLLAYCGGAKEVFEASKKQLRKIPGIGAVLSNFERHLVLENAEKELEILEKYDIETIFMTDSKYPFRLKEYSDSPFLLFVRGAVNFNAKRIISVVGTRTPSVEGREMCRKLVAELTDYQPVIVSGLAYGIDQTAHNAALENGLDTIAVLAHGLTDVYPSEHLALSRKIVEQGALISEFPPSTLIRKEYFPMRNRIIAALCDALIVVETKRRGGSMISANFANDYNKDVFAVPGRPGDPMTAGGNFLIKSHKASLIEDAEDLIYMMRWEKNPLNVQPSLFIQLSKVEEIVMSCFDLKQKISLEDLILRTALSINKLSGILMEMELKGLIRALPGNRYLKL